MTKGIVYLLTNPCLEGWVKIGMTGKDDIAVRLKSLNASTSIPLSFRVYAEYHVEEPEEVEHCIHKLIDLVDSDLRAREFDDNARIIREREFFQISVENAYKLFQEVAHLRNDSKNLILISPTEEEIEEQEIAERAQRKKWDEESFFKSVAASDEAKIEGVSSLYEFSKEVGQISWGTGAKWGTFRVAIPVLGARNVYVVSHDGNIDFHLWAFEDQPILHAKLVTLINSLRDTSFGERRNQVVFFEEWQPKFEEFEQAISELIAQSSI